MIKVERPDGGDACRALLLADMAFDGESALFHTINRGKESYAARPEERRRSGRGVELVARADVMIHNFRPGVMDRLGLDWDAVRALNPRLIYAGVTGYGADGPWRDRPGQDLLVQSLSGLAWLSGDADDPPVPAGVSIADMMAGAHLCRASSRCWYARGVTGAAGGSMSA